MSKALSAANLFRVDITPYFISLIDPNDPYDPIRKQVVPTDAELLGLEPLEVNAAIAALPAWEKLVRFARGRAPQVAVPPPRKGSVRKSSPPGI